jgi:putative ABC transport system substrate-binding protein
MKRRALLAGLGGAALLAPLAARAQQPPLPVIGYLSSRSQESDVPMLAAFRQGLSDAGYVEGRDVRIELRWAGGEYSRLPALVDELVRRRVAVIATGGGAIPARAAKAATATVPIVFVSGDDPVAEGLVASFNRPGGNLTGVTSMLRAIAAKSIGLLSDLVPNAAAVAMLVNPNDGRSAVQISDMQAAARQLAQPLVVLRAGTVDEIDAAFGRLVGERAGGLVVSVGAFFVTHAHRIVALAARHAIPTIYPRREYVETGGLMSYGSSTAESYRLLGNYAGRILKGEKAADLPIQIATKFELVVNMKTVKALGITIPSGIHSIIDEVIE